MQAPHVVKIHLKKSKCDQFGVGSDIFLGGTNQVLCPVTVVLEYIKKRGSSPGPFFVNAGQRVIAKPWFVGQIRSILTAVGLPQANSRYYNMKE